MRQKIRKFVFLQLAAILLLPTFLIEIPAHDTQQKTVSENNFMRVQEMKTDSEHFQDLKAIADFYLQMSKKGELPAENKKSVEEFVNEFPKLSMSIAPPPGVNPCPKGYEWQGTRCVKVNISANSFQDLRAIADLYLRIIKKGDLPSEITENVKRFNLNFSDQSASFATCPKGYEKRNGKCVKVN